MSTQHKGLYAVTGSMPLNTTWWESQMATAITLESCCLACVLPINIWLATLMCWTTWAFCLIQQSSYILLYSISNSQVYRLANPTCEACTVHFPVTYWGRSRCGMSACLPSYFPSCMLDICGLEDQHCPASIGSLKNHTF